MRLEKEADAEAVSDGTGDRADPSSSHGTRESHGAQPSLEPVPDPNAAARR
ncbi:MAG: hypothetical protein IT307_05180 [Chloroflexi bacterium]|nr:hypothetical protein [Chloroflexota bacterium]